MHKNSQFDDESKTLEVFEWTTIRAEVLNLFEKSGNTFDYMKNLHYTKINDPKSISRRNKYILENILLNTFKFYILKYIIKFLQSYDNNNKKKIRLLIPRNTCKKLAKHRLRTGVLEDKIIVCRNK